MVKIRLQRFGRKGKPFYRIVVADARCPRDGKFVDRLGTYDPLTSPSTIELDMDKALDWLEKGAQPTDKTRSILSSQGVLYKKHLLGGVKKGALTFAQAEEKFTLWLSAKVEKTTASKKEMSEKLSDAAKARMQAETKVKEARAEAIASKIQEKKLAEQALLDAASKAETSTQTSQTAESDE